jgi:hypothetical protein
MFNVLHALQSRVSLPGVLKKFLPAVKRLGPK